MDSTGGWVERPMQHEMKLSAVLVSRPKPECYIPIKHYLTCYDLFIVCMGGSEEFCTKVVYDHTPLLTVHT